MSRFNNLNNLNTLNYSKVSNVSFDADALAYITAVETADGQSLEYGVKTAINSFIVGCKVDGIWNAIKSSAILAGARTLTGALVPLKGTAPTNFNFVSGDYNRKTGLVGDGSTKYLDSNRNGNADPQNNAHLLIYASTASTSFSAYAGCQTSSINAVGQNGIFSVAPAGNAPFRSRLTAFDVDHEGTRSLVTATGFIGWSRSASGFFIARDTSTNQTISAPSSASTALPYYIFARNTASAANSFADARLAFYSIGEALDLALLDARVSQLMTDLNNIIP